MRHQFPGSLLQWLQARQLSPLWAGRFRHRRCGCNGRRNVVVVLLDFCVLNDATELVFFLPVFQRTGDLFDALIQDSMDLSCSLFTAAVFLTAFFRVTVFFLARAATPVPLLFPEFPDLRVHFLPGQTSPLFFHHGIGLFHSRYVYFPLLIQSLYQP